MHHAPGLSSEYQVAPAEAPSSSASIVPLTASRRRRAFLRRLAAMSAAGRRQAFESGHFSRGQRALWASTYSEEVELVNGELPWIAVDLADNE
jgi:hypothetical protein